MKTRNGFVSNSSSTSFLIAVKKSKNNDFSDPATVIDFLVNHSDSKSSYEDLKFFTKTGKQYDKMLREEIKELEKDIKWCEEQDGIFKEALQNEDVMEILGRMDYVQKFQHDDAKRESDQLRMAREYRMSVRGELETKAKSMEDMIKYRKINIEELQEKLEEIKPYLDGEWRLIGFEEDHWSGILKSAVEDMAANGNAIIIEKVGT